MSPTSFVVGTGLEKSLPMRSGRAGASLSGTVVLLEAFGQMSGRLGTLTAIMPTADSGEVAWSGVESADARP